MAERSAKIQQHINTEPTYDNKKKKSKGKRKRQNKIDITFLIIVLFLLGIGLMMMFSASFSIALNRTGDGMYFVKRQGTFAVGGLCLMFFISKLDYHIYYKIPCFRYGIPGFALFLMVLTLIIPSERSDGIKRWLRIGPVQFQPSEFLKAAVILFIAYLIVSKHKEMGNFMKGMFPSLCVLGVSAGLMMLQKHYSGLAIIGMIGMIMLLVGGADIKQWLLIASVGVAAFVTLMYIKISDPNSHVSTRYVSWVDPFNPETMLDETLQTSQSLVAIGSGGIFGLGLGNSRQKFGYLPEAQNDFIFAIICEELGFIGAMAIVLLFLVFVLRGFYIANHAPDKFGMLVAVGITFQIGLQAFLNIAVVTNTILNTGISLPFFSYGGTAIVVQLAEMGIVLNISRQMSKE